MIILDAVKCPNGIKIEGDTSMTIAAGGSLDGAPEFIRADLLASGLAFDDTPLTLTAEEVAALEGIGFTPETVAPFVEAGDA